MVSSNGLSAYRTLLRTRININVAVKNKTPQVERAVWNFTRLRRASDQAHNYCFKSLTITHGCDMQYVINYNFYDE